MRPSAATTPSEAEGAPVRAAIDAGLSAKLRALAPVGILMVVVGHSPSIRDPSAPSDRSVPYATIEFLLADALPRTGIAMFFAIAGFLFFHGHDGSRTSHRRKIASRARSLVVPYFAWSTISLGIYFILQSLPWTSGWFTNPARRVVDRPAGDVLLLWAFDPIAYQLWFLRDLFLLAFASPLLMVLLRRAGALTVAALGVASFLDFTIPGPVAGTPLMNGDGYLWFAVGGWFALKRMPLSASAWATLPLLVAVVAVALARSWLHAIDGQDHVRLQKIVYLVGVPALWIGYDRWLRWLERPFFQAAAGYVFFVYAAHEPLMTMLRKPLMRWLGPGDLRHAVQLLATLGGTLVLVLALGALLLSRWPRAWSFLCGGRGTSDGPQKRSL